MGSIHITKWLTEGKPTGVAFRLQRTFEMDTLQKLGPDADAYVKAFMLSIARVYARDNDFRFLPACTEEWIPSLRDSYVLSSEKGDILVDMIFADADDEGMLWAGVTMKTFERGA